MMANNTPQNMQIDTFSVDKTFKKLHLKNRSRINAGLHLPVQLENEESRNLSVWLGQQQESCYNHKSVILWSS